MRRVTKTIRAAALLSVVGAVGIGCGADAANERAVDASTPALEVREEVGETSAAISDVTGYTDPVCGMKLAEDAPTRTTHEGITHGFCSEACKDKFTANPAMYLAAVEE